MTLYFPQICISTYLHIPDSEKIAQFWDFHLINPPNQYRSTISHMVTWAMCIVAAGGPIINNKTLNGTGTKLA